MSQMKKVWRCIATLTLWYWILSGFHSLISKATPWPLMGGETVDRATHGEASCEVWGVMARENEWDMVLFLQGYTHRWILWIEWINRQREKTHRCTKHSQMNVQKPAHAYTYAHTHIIIIIAICGTKVLRCDPEGGSPHPYFLSLEVRGVQPLLI